MFERDAVDLRRIAAGAGVVALGIVIALGVSYFFAPEAFLPERPKSAGPGLETAPLDDMTQYQREKAAAFKQRLGAVVPMDAPLVDDRGRKVSLGEEVDARPTVLMMGYLGCRDLCPMAVTGVDEVLRASGVATRDYRALFVSIDPRDAPSLGIQKAARLGDSRDAWTFLGGDEAAVSRIARAVGFGYRRDENEDFTHPEGFVVLTPKGSVSRYFFGVRFDPGEVSAALRTASHEGTGSLVSRIAFLCSHFDPVSGKYGPAVLNVLRAAAILMLLVACAWAWSRR